MCVCVSDTLAWLGCYQYGLDVKANQLSPELSCGYNFDISYLILGVGWPPSFIVQSQK